MSVSPRQDRGSRLALAALTLLAVSVTGPLAGQSFSPSGPSLQPGEPASEEPRAPSFRTLGALSHALGGSGVHIPMSSAGTTGCVLRQMNCNQTIFANINTQDCATNSQDTFFDVWEFPANNGDQVIIEMNSTQLDPFLLLLDPVGDLFDDDDDSGPGVNARINTVLDQSGTWSIGASGLPGFSQTGSYSLSVTCNPTQPPPPAANCVPNDTTLCLVDDRFRVEVEWQTSQGTSGPGMAVQLTSDTGYFWFFEESNVEMVIKVLDACSFADRFWVFAGGLTNVEVEMFVTDTERGNQTQRYTNPLNTPFQTIQDTNAFLTCP